MRMCNAERREYMLRHLLENDPLPKSSVHQEGDLFKVITLYGKTFEIRFGYYEEIDRQNEPMEIYLDFTLNPVYTDDGFPFVTHMQAPCEYYRKKGTDSDRDCSTCWYLEQGEELIGVCRCKKRQR